MYSRGAASAYAHGTLFDEPYTTQCYCDGKWVRVQSVGLLPGDVASLGEWLYSPKEFSY